MIRNILFRTWRWIVGWFRAEPPPLFTMCYIESDELPDEIPEKTLVVAREDGDLWSAGMICPCGCKRRIELMLLPGVKPRWDLHVDSAGAPTLSPSVWAADGCRSHFWLRRGEISWCRD